MISKDFTIGVEEEYMICDPLSGELVDKADIIMSHLPEGRVDRFSYELLLSEIESNTKICNNVKEAIDELRLNRDFLKKTGKINNYSIGLSGTHPTAKPSEQTFVNNDSYNWVSNQLNYYAKRNITFSTHVHIGLSKSSDIIKATNSLRRWIAPMLALSANSPFFEGELTGMHSSRTFQFSTFPRTNIPAYINNLSEYNKLVQLYKDTKSIEKDRQIWWKIRPHIEYGTVEFRVCDVQLSLKNTEMIVALVQALVHTIVNDDMSTKSDYNYEILQDGLWKSSKYGIDCLIVDPLDEKNINMKTMIKKMLNYCKDSLEYFNTTHIIETVNLILKDGSESYVQLGLYEKGGFSKLKQHLLDSDNW